MDELAHEHNIPQLFVHPASELPDETGEIGALCDAEFCTDVQKSALEMARNSIPTSFKCHPSINFCTVWWP